MSEDLCNRCGCFPSVFFRAYSGERLCRRCFNVLFEDRVQDTISRYGMLLPNDRIAVALSGGKDSASLLRVMARLEERFPKAKLLAVTVDEGIRGYRREALELARKNCRKLSVPHRTASFKDLFGLTLDEILKDEARSRLGLSSCSICGILRRRALNLLAKEVGTTKIATAHNLDDEIQTVVLNMIHGDTSRLLKLSPVSRDSPSFISRIKPFYRTPENEIALYAFLNGIEFQSVPCPYMQESTRSQVRAFLNRLEVDHSGIKYTLLSSYEKIQSSVGEPVEDAYKVCRICGETSVRDICRVCEVLPKLRDAGKRQRTAQRSAPRACGKPSS